MAKNKDVKLKIADDILNFYNREKYDLVKIAEILCDEEYSQYGKSKTICYVLDLDFSKEKSNLLGFIDRE